MYVSQRIGHKNDISFRSQKIFPVKIYDRCAKPVDAWFSRLKSTDAEDREAVDFLDETRKIVPRSKCEFDKSVPTFAIELPGKEKLKDRIRCLALLGNNYKSRIKDDKVFYVDRIDVIPEDRHDNPCRTYRRVGTAMIYGLTKFAKRLNCNKLRLWNAKHAFYNDGLGMSNEYVSKIFRIPFAKIERDEMDGFIRGMEQTYNS